MRLTQEGRDGGLGGLATAVCGGKEAVAPCCLPHHGSPEDRCSSPGDWGRPGKVPELVCKNTWEWMEDGVQSQAGPAPAGRCGHRQALLSAPRSPHLLSAGDTTTPGTVMGAL